MKAGRELDRMVAEKECPACDEVKPADEYWRDENRPDGLRKKCKPCVRKRKRKWYEENKEEIAEKRQREKPWRSESFREYRRDWQLRDRYGLSLDDFEELSEEQGGRCAICGQPPVSDQKGETLHVDHCHGSGAVRGLLCNRCNVGLANFRDNPEWLRAAARYLCENK